MKNMKFLSDTRFRSDLVLASFAPLTFFIFGCLNTFFHNSSELSYFVMPVLLSLATVALALTVVFFALLWASHRIGAHKWVSLALFSFGIGLWLQGNFFVRQYGIFDGKEIDWARFEQYALLDVALWSGTFILIFAAGRWTYRMAPKIAIIALIAQLVAVASISGGYKAPRYETDDSRKFVFSGKNDVMLLVLDSFAYDMFRYAILPNEKYYSFLDGFTFYTDVMSQYPTTVPSPTNFLTGQKFLNQKDFVTFRSEAFHSEQSLPYRLLEKGYEVYLGGVSVDLTPKTCSNITYAKAPLWYSLTDLKMILLATAFRAAPHQLKPLVYEKYLAGYAANEDKEHTGGLPGNLDFLKAIEKEIRVDDSIKNGTFKYFHLYGMHPPCRIDESLELLEETVHTTECAQANLRIVERSLSTLKNSGLYDNTLIIIMGDHGFWTPERPNNYSYGDMSYINPILMIKPPGSRGSMKFSDKPAVLSDIRPTITDIIGADQIEMSGVSLLRDTSTQNGIRRYYSYDGIKTTNGYLPDIVEYIVNGNSIDERNWTRTGRVFIPGEAVNSDDPLSAEPDVTFGKTISFGRLSSPGTMLLDGWGGLGVLELYPVSKKAGMKLRFTDLDKGFIKLDLKVSLVRQNTPQRVVVSINNKKIGENIASGDFQLISFYFSGDFLNENPDNIISFEFPKAFKSNNIPEVPGLEGDMSIVMHEMTFAKLK